MNDLLPTPRASDGEGGTDPLRRPIKNDDIATRIKRLTHETATNTGRLFTGSRRLSASEQAQEGGHQVTLADQTEHDLDPTNWGPYEPAITRWSWIMGRPSPRPTEPTGRDGAERLSPRFVEWLMGQADGWFTDPAIDISRNEELKVGGNGVVTQQAVAALRDMAPVTGVRLPDLPGLVRGIVAVETDARGRNRYTLQCENCFALETPAHLVLMETHFHTRGDDRRRLCRACRVELFKDCACHHCREDRTGSEF